MTDLRDQRTAVYRFFDAEGRLLYVGIAVDVVTRWAWHQRHADWWPLHESSTVQWYPNRTVAAQQELHAIRSERPVANIQGRGQTPLQSFRFPGDLWRQFADVAGCAETNRSEVLRNFIRWYTGEPGATEPERPTER